jgi:hypothetical protein
MSFLSQPITLQSLFGTKRTIGPITVQTPINEETTDVLTVTKQPVQSGAPITDHAYQEPTVLTMNILQQNNTSILGLQELTETFSGPGAGGLAQIYQTFLSLQSSRVPFNVLTPKRVYKNMLITTLRQNTDSKTENILSLSITLQQVIIVSVGTVQVPPTQQTNPAATQATQNAGQKSSFLLQGAQLINPNTVGYQQ